MIRQPRPGQRVELHYGGPRRKDAPSMREWVGLHLARGVVAIAGGGLRGGAMSRAWLDEHHHGERKGSPVNALVEMEDGRRTGVPRGQLFEVGSSTQEGKA